MLEVGQILCEKVNKMSPEQQYMEVKFWMDDMERPHVLFEEIQCMENGKYRQLNILGVDLMISELGLEQEYHTFTLIERKQPLLK